MDRLPEYTNFMRKESLKVGSGQYSSVPLDTHHFPKDGKAKYFAGHRSHPDTEKYVTTQSEILPDRQSVVDSKELGLLEDTVERMEAQRDEIFGALKSVAAVYELHMAELKGQLSILDSKLNS